MRAEYAEWLRENLVTIPLVLLAVVAAGVAFWCAGTLLGTWLLPRSERRRASHGEARR